MEIQLLQTTLYSWAQSHTGRDPFNQTFRKFRSKTQWIGSVQPEKFRKNGSTSLGGPLFPVGPVGILVEWIAPTDMAGNNHIHGKDCMHACSNSNTVISEKTKKTKIFIQP